jgi:hypothetical protein
MKYAQLGLTYLFAFVFIVFGSNYYLQFLPLPPMEGVGGQYMGIIFNAKVLMIVKTLEILCGILIAANYYRALALSIMLPITINILLFHLLIAGDNPIMAFLLVAINIFLLYCHKDKFMGLFSAK